MLSPLKLRFTLKASSAGVSLILAVVILAGVLATTFIITTVVLRTSQSSKEIGVSELAFYAAESGVEEILWEINKNQQKCVVNNTNVNYCSNNHLENASGVLSNGLIWQVEILQEITALPACASGANPCNQSGGNISFPAVDQMQVTLAPGESFQLSLDLRGAHYPLTLNLNWSGSPSQVIVEEGFYGQSVDDHYEFNETSSLPIIIPQLGSIDPSRYYFIRINNTSTNTEVYEIYPSPGSQASLPIGITVRTVSSTLNSQRKVEVTDYHWEFF